MTCNTLSYFTPAHGAWNLAHICRLLPESHALFAQPVGCSRVISMSALEQGLLGKFSVLNLSEVDIASGVTEKLIYCAAEEVIHRYHPGALFVFTGCISDFIGTDRDVYLTSLRSAFPDTIILDGRMDPINRCSGIPPIIRMQNLLTSVFTRNAEEKNVNFLGSFTPFEDGQELVEHLQSMGYGTLHPYNCTTLSEYRAMGNSALNIILGPTALPAAQSLRETLGIPFVDLSDVNDFYLLEQGYGEVCAVLGIPEPDLTRARGDCRAALNQLREELGERQVYIDDGYTPHPFFLASELLKSGINVGRIFTSGMSLNATEQKESMRDLVDIVEGETPENAKVYKSRIYANEDAVCAGEYCAYAAHSKHYIRGLHFSGRFGYHGFKKTALELAEAAATERPLTDIQTCGWGCFGL